MLHRVGVPFPRNFLSVAKTILKRLFRVYAHVYHQHRDDVRRLDEEAHLNTSFKHFIYFIEEFNLIDKKELTPLQDLIDILNAKDQRWNVCCRDAPIISIIQSIFWLFANNTRCLPIVSLHSHPVSITGRLCSATDTTGVL